MRAIRTAQLLEAFRVTARRVQAFALLTDCTFVVAQSELPDDEQTGRITTTYDQGTTTIAATVDGGPTEVLTLDELEAALLGRDLHTIDPGVHGDQANA